MKSKQRWIIVANHGQNLPCLDNREQGCPFGLTLDLVSKTYNFYGIPDRLDQRVGVREQHPAVGLHTSTQRSGLVLGGDACAEQRNGVGLHDLLFGLSGVCAASARVETASL